MLPMLRGFGVGVVLFLMATPTTSFSHGASSGSCQDMIPNHIRVHPQNLQHRYITVRTSASSYLPGQFITVTVRSSRDFMGFLLQARSAEGTFSRAGGGAGVRFRAKPGAGVRRSTRGGPVLVGGSWILTPPGTHTLRCLSEGDTVTHSDKQLKRNLSFVWRAPDAPMGDIRFYITVVQSYFVYWAGIESTVVHDASRSLWSGSNTTRMNGTSAVFALLQEKVTALPVLRAFTSLNEQANETKRPATNLGLPARTSNGPNIYKSLPTEVSHSALGMSSSVTLASLGVDKKENFTLGSLQNYTQTPFGSISGETKEAGIDLIPQTKDPKSSSSSLAIFPSAEAKGIDTTTTFLPNITVQVSTSPRPQLQSLFPLFSVKNGVTEKRDPNLKLQDPKLPTGLKTKDTTTITKTIASGNHSFQKTNSPKLTSQTPQTPIKGEESSARFKTQSGSAQLHITSITEPQTSPNKAEIGSWSQNPSFQNSSPKPLVHFQTSTFKLVLWTKTSTSQTFSFLSASSVKPLSQFQTSPNSNSPSSSPTPQSSLQSNTISFLTYPENSPSALESSPRQSSTPFPKLQTTTTVLSSSIQPQSLSNFHQDQPETTQTQIQTQTTIPQTDPSLSEIPHEASSASPQLWSQPMFQTGQKLTQSLRTPKDLNPLLFRLRTDQTPILDKSNVELKSEVRIRTTSPVFAFMPSATPSPPISGTTHLDSTSFSSNDILPTTTGSALLSLNLSARSTLFTSSSLSSIKNHLQTTPAISALHSPSPISSPPYSSSSQPTPTAPPPSSFFSSTIASLSSSNYPSSALLLTPAPLSTVTSSQCITNSTNSSSSFATPPTSSSPFSSLISTSTTSSVLLGSSTSFISSSTSEPSIQSTSPHPGPSPAPRRSMYNVLMSSAPTQKLTVGQQLLIHRHAASYDPDPSLNLLTPRTETHLNPKPYPNMKKNLGHELKPSFPNTDIKRPSSPPATPDKEGKYPDITPRHSAWELGMLLGSSAGLGMALVVGIRYMYRQACRKRTEVTLNDRDREYGRGDRGLIHVQECGDLVRVRKIRENSLVLLAEYDILAPPGERNTGCQQRC